VPLQLDQLGHMPGAITQVGVRQVRQVFPNPTLVHLKGERDPPVFLATLLHGNETTSFAVLQHLARRVAAGRLRRSLLVFIGNVAAAEAGKRHLDGQPDFNRIWGHGDTAHHRLAGQVLDVARRSGILASIDVHNNTGRNPVYGCINSMRPEDLHLASRFAPIGVYYLNPPTTQSIAFSHLGPAITLECGQSGDADGLAAAIDLLDYVLDCESLPRQPPPAGAVRLFQTVGRVVVEPARRLSFGPAPGAELVFRPDLPELNFKPVEQGALWAVSECGPGGLRVLDEHGGDLTDQFFDTSGPAISLRQSIVPAMITEDQDIIRSDCLCYLMKPLDWHPATGPPAGD